ncbi:MAG: Glu-tRNA(Gln) amidotransferase subunit GatD [Thermoplasmatales archaeon]|nr:Glu-tRNA(Gln) amidotransferase subunit GatD [Thermoplasmatales archaeon]
MDFETGDLVEIKNKKGIFRGIVMPRHAFSGEDIIILKLDNGYNIGIKVDDETKIKIISKGLSKKTERKSRINENGIPVSVLGTGGTIASYIDYSTGAVKPAVSQEELLLAIPEIEENYRIKSRTIFSILSENMKVKNWKVIAEEAFKDLDDSRGIIIPHGTDTMAYTASALAFMLQNLPSPIILVGAQRSSDRPSSDAYLNLIYSLKLVETDLGEVVISMHGSTSDTFVQVHRGVRARKMHTSRRDAFRSINEKPIAIIENEVRFISSYRKRSGPPVLRTGMDEKVALLYYYPNMDPEILLDIGSRMHGIIIAGTGLGHVSNDMIPVIRDLVSRGVFVGVTSQCLYGSVNLNVYSTGREMIIAGAVPLKDMLPEVAYVKLMWVLENYPGEERDKMLQNLVGEISERRVGIEYV